MRKIERSSSGIAFRVITNCWDTAQLVAAGSDASAKAGLSPYPGIFRPDTERIVTGVTIQGCVKLGVAGTKDQVVLIVRRQKPPNLPVGPEPAEYFLSFYDRPMRDKEMKRRANVVGAFHNEAAVKRPVEALMLEQNDEWAITQRHAKLETEAAIYNTIFMDPTTIAAQQLRPSLGRRTKLHHSQRHCPA